MEIVTIGSPQAGKTTVFHALTRGAASAVSHHSKRLQPTIGVVKVPDPRLEVLSKIFHPQRLVPAEVRYADVPALVPGEARKGGLVGELLNLLQGADALLHVVRGFDIPSEREGTGPAQEIADIDDELAIADLEIP